LRAQAGRLEKSDVVDCTIATAALGALEWNTRHSDQRVVEKASEHFVSHNRHLFIQGSAQEWVALMNG
jgi:hypothetical protein